MVRRRKPAAERRAEILTAALALFAAQGYDAVVMDDIARACQLARPTLYEYFANKEEILLGLAADVLEHAPRSIPPAGTCRERLTAAVAAELGYIQANRMVYRLLFQKLPGLSGPLAERIAEGQRAYGQAVLAALEAGAAAGEVRPGLTPAEGAVLLLALTGHAGQSVLVSEDAVDVQTLASRLIDLAWRGIGA